MPGCCRHPDACNSLPACTTTPKPCPAPRRLHIYRRVLVTSSACGLPAPSSCALALPPFVATIATSPLSDILGASSSVRCGRNAACLLYPIFASLLRSIARYGSLSPNFHVPEAGVYGKIPSAMPDSSARDSLVHQVPFSRRLSVYRYFVNSPVRAISNALRLLSIKQRPS